MIKRSDGITIYTGSHVGSRGSLSSIKHCGSEDFTNIDIEWEQNVKNAMITIENSFHCEQELLDEQDSQMISLICQLWGPEYRHNEQEECACSIFRRI